MKVALKSATPAELAHYREAYLWIFFNGAHYEQRVKGENLRKYTGTSKPWFSEMLITHARLLGVTTWLDLRDLLKEFVFYDLLKLNLASWFGDTIGKEK